MICLPLLSLCIVKARARVTFRQCGMSAHVLLSGSVALLLEEDAEENVWISRRGGKRNAE